MRAFESSLRQQNAIVADDPHGHPLDLGKTTHQRGAIARLELIKVRAVHHPRDHLAYVIRRAQICGNNAQHLCRVIGGCFARQGGA